MLGEVISIYIFLALHDPMSLGMAFQRSLTSVICACPLCAREAGYASDKLMMYCVGACVVLIRIWLCMTLLTNSPLREVRHPIDRVICLFVVCLIILSESYLHCTLQPCNYLCILSIA